MILPSTSNLKTSCLSRIFDNTTESYKFFWFNAILQKILEGRRELSFEELVDDMIATAWYMVSEYHLNLGPSDTMEKLILELQDSVPFSPAEKKHRILEFLSSSHDANIISKKNVLINEVPYRLQSTLLTLKAEDWQKGAKKRIEYINCHEGLIYRFGEFEGLSTRIFINDDWASYITDNAAFLEGWYRYDLISYLQKRNPSVPGIPYKLEPPAERKLADVASYWRTILDIRPLKEIYGGRVLEKNDISIDHFIPWSYIASDELWNLHPTTKAINSSKNNNLPDWERYFKPLCRIEFTSYEIMHSYPQIKDCFEKLAKNHFSSIETKERLYSRRNLTFDSFSSSLRDVIEPQYRAAANCGFGT